MCVEVVCEFELLVPVGVGLKWVKKTDRWIAAEALEESYKAVVSAFYEALSARDADKIHRILAPDLEWWFHGPPSHQFLMRLLTGDLLDFEFHPHSIAAAFGNIVLVEGFDHLRSIAWVHAWTVTDHGIITQVREYFNTDLTVTRIGTNANALHCPSVWESSLPGRVGKSVPGVVLAI
ncbi:hypothetical protein M569_03336 [Genlisea aurea]|uniref:Wound-induced protein 1 n=1 Tax=Genlisea aurea TaxID=192259 RepID=S8CVL0_9LAMI|nr:hypothetical protein M569_03336 [Genlisea aurea]